MTVTENGPSRGGVKTLAIRLEPEQHAQLTLIAQLRGSTITDEIKQALEAHITVASGTPELAARAGGALEEIERDADARRVAISTLFGTKSSESAVPPPAKNSPKVGTQPNR